MSGLEISTLGAREVRNNHDLVVDGLGRAIVEGVYPEGKQIPRDEQLAETFSVSRTVLREAMKTLAAMGMVRARTRVGTTVTSRKEWNLFDSRVLSWHVSFAENDGFYEQLFEIRLAFEPFAAKLAARRADKDDIKSMREHLDHMFKSSTDVEFANADLQFHRRIFDATGNAFFQSLVSLLEAVFLTALEKSSPLANPTSQYDVTKRHERIVDAIEDRDGDTAAAAMRNVIQAGWSRIATTADFKP